MHPTERILQRAKQLVASGFVRERDCHSAEDNRGNLLQYTDQRAKRFCPSGAIWRAESEILKIPKRGNKPIGGEALSLLVQSGYSVQLYRSAKSIGDITSIFDKALARFGEQEAKDRQQKRRDRALRQDDLDQFGFELLAKA